MSSSISSSDRWRRFFRLAAGTGALVVAVVYAFVVLLDPFDTLPLSPPADRIQVASNARFAFPSLARSHRFDSALFGTSTSRLLRPAALDPLLGTRLANLSMNDATVWEQARLMQVFLRAHPDPKLVMWGLDVRWCVTGDTYQRLTGRTFPDWLYQDNPWAGYGEMLNLYAVQSAGQLFGILAGIKPAVYGRDGYTRFVPPDSAYDRAKVAANLRAAGVSVPPGIRTGPPAAWRYPALELLRDHLAMLPAQTRKLVFFVPYHRVMLPPPGTEAAAVWDECKRRVAAMARTMPNLHVADFLIPSPITTEDDNYWDPQHYTVAAADRLARGLAAALRGEASDDYRLLAP
ncbi:MAG: hypothetical protein AB7F35_09765 [Acetobacteraceae bacterium]